VKQWSVAGVKPPFKNSEHWKMRAEEAKAVAELLQDPASRIEMLRIAEGYGRLAERARNNSDAAENSTEALLKK
jgi:hypothetical protein